MDLSVVVLNYNTKDLLKQTLRSIQAKTSTEVIVVDNASTDGSTTMVRQYFTQAILIESKKNIGFAAGNNLGLQKAKGKYILLLNSDTEIKPGSLDKMIQYLEKQSEVGILTPKLVLENGALDPACHRGFPTLWSSFTYYSGLEKIFKKSKLFGQYHQTWKDISKTHPVDVVSGAAMMFRRQVLEEVGFLDEQFFMYAEDIDYCKRAKDAGWSIMYYPKATVIHYKGRSGTYHVDPNIRKQTRSHFYDTMKQYFRKHYRSQYPEWVLLVIDKSIDLVARIRG